METEARPKEALLPRNLEQIASPGASVASSEAFTVHHTGANHGGLPSYRQLRYKKQEVRVLERSEFLFHKISQAVSQFQSTKLWLKTRTQNCGDVKDRRF